MSSYICKGCGRETNSVCSGFVTKGEPNHCYAAFENGKWVKGCGFDRASDFDKAYAMSLITGKDIKKFLREKP